MDDNSLLKKNGRCTSVATYKGFHVDLLEPDPADINIVDIAHHLSLVCRFNGATREFYSVAEHSVRCADIAFDLGKPYVVQLAVLMHDAHEAYCQDMTRPRKKLEEQLGCRFTSDLEDRFMDVVCRVFDIPILPSTQEAIKQADNIMVRAECEQLIEGGGKNYEWGETPRVDTHLECWSPKEAKARFLARFDSLSQDIKDILS